VIAAAAAICGAVVAIIGPRITALLLVSAVASAVCLLLRSVHTFAGSLLDHSQSVSQSAAMAEVHYIDVLQRIVHSVEARDTYTVGHSERVGRLARQIGEYMGLSAIQCYQLDIAARLHDIGMVAIPPQILTGHPKLGLEGFRAVKQHSEFGYEVLKPIECIAEMLPAVRYHHERMNGTGYPAGLKGEDIPLPARILAVVDAYDAMTHDRPHRHAMSPLAAMQELTRCTPAGYDPACVNALAECMNLPVLQEAMSP